MRHLSNLHQGGVHGAKLFNTKLKNWKYSGKCYHKRTSVEFLTLIRWKKLCDIFDENFAVLEAQLCCLSSSWKVLSQWIKSLQRRMVEWFGGVCPTLSWTTRKLGSWNWEKKTSIGFGKKYWPRKGLKNWSRIRPLQLSFEHQPGTQTTELLAKITTWMLRRGEILLKIFGCFVRLETFLDNKLIENVFVLLL